MAPNRRERDYRMGLQSSALFTVQNQYYKDCPTCFSNCSSIIYRPLLFKVSVYKITWRWTWKNGVCVYGRRWSSLAADSDPGTCVLHPSVWCCFNFYEIGITGPRQSPVREECASIFNILPSWQPRSSESNAPWVVFHMCPCSAFSKFPLTGKQGANTFKISSYLILIHCQLCLLKLYAQFWGGGSAVWSFLYVVTTWTTNDA